MVKVKLYRKKDCMQCDQVLTDLGSLSVEIPHQVEVVDIEQDSSAQRAFGDLVPVLVVGPYLLKAPINSSDLKITLLAAQRGIEQNQAINQAIENGQFPAVTNFTKADRFSYWLSKHYLAILNIFVLVYVGLPILAPVLMKVEASAPATIIYRVYGSMCHQLAFRSWFLFGEQFAYPRAAAGVPGLVPYDQATGMNDQDLLGARQLIGDPVLGYKMALCERDIAIYGSILVFGVLFTLTGRRIRSYPWYFWILLALVPIALDGVSQLLSQPPFNFIPYRESTPFLRTLTGFLFGFMTAWFGYPMVEESMAESRKYMEAKLARVSNAVPRT
jgi:uncharacterized membrane protein